MVDIVPLSLAMAAAAFVVNAYLAYSIQSDLKNGNSDSANSMSTYILYGSVVCAIVAGIIVAFNWHF